MTFEHLSLLVQGRAQNKWINRRASVRYRCAPATVGKITSPARDELFRVFILDLSRTGIGIVASRPLLPGADLFIQIACPGPTKRLEFPARVVHTAVQPNGDWLIGLEFPSPISQDELDTVLD